MKQYMRPMLAVMAVVLVTQAMAQDLLLNPKWKRDDLRTLYITRTVTTPGVDEEGGTLNEVATQNTSAKVKVYDISPEKVLISIDHENVVLPLVRPYFEAGLPGGIDPYKRMIIRYEVERGTGASSLLNATDLTQFAQRAADQAVRALRRTDEKGALRLEQELAPLVAQFNDPALVEQFFDQRFGFLTLVFGQPLTQGDPLVLEEVTADPFRAQGDSMLVSVSLELLSQSADQAVVRAIRSLDDRPQAVTGKAAAPRAKPANDAISVSSWQQEQLITIDTKTTWPLRASMNTSIGLSNGMVATEEVSIEVR